MKSAPSAYLNVTLPVSIQRGTSRTSSCSTLTHSTGPMPSGNGKSSGALNGSVVCQSPSSQMIGGFRHSSIVVQMLNTGANAKPGISRSPPSRTWTSRTSSKSCFAAWAAKTSVRPGSMPMPQSASLPRAFQASARANCSSPSFRPGSSWGRSGCGFERLIAMSM